jgi:hypothetical protein
MLFLAITTAAIYSDAAELKVVAPQPRLTNQYKTAQSSAPVIDEEMYQLEFKHMSALANLEEEHHAKIVTEKHDFHQRLYEIMERRVPGSSKIKKQMEDAQEQRSEQFHALDQQQKKELLSVPREQWRDRKTRNALEEKYKSLRLALQAKWQKNMQGLRPAAGAAPRKPAPQPAAEPKPPK